jgi:N-acetyl-gamma-glutamyl-phosphate reductase
MIDMVPVHLDLLAAGTKAADLHAILAARYAGEAFVRVLPMNSDEILTRGAFLRPDRLLDTNNLEIIVYANDARRQALLVACYDNLGKGASGAAVQNLNIALGLDETKGVNLG